MSKVPIYPPIKSIEIQLHWQDKAVQVGKSFSTIQELANFLKENPELAKAVNYNPKK